MENRIIAPNLAELYRCAAQHYDALPAFATRKSALDWVPVSFRELYSRGLELATGLIDLGVEARSHVGLFGDNRYEWILADCGVQLCGAADVPRGRDITDRELKSIVNHAGIRIAFVETEALQERIFNLREHMPELREVILLDPVGKAAPGVIPMQEVIRRGAALREQGDGRVEERIRRIQPDDLFTLIYTSGTTGKPKGVMLTHAGMMSQIETIPIRIGLTDRVLSILPVWHIYERVFEMLAISCGGCTYYSSARTLGEDLKNVEPTFMGSAPRLWEKLHERILKNVRKSHPVRRGLFHIAYFLSKHYRDSVFYLTGRRIALKPPNPIKTAMLGATHALRWVLLLPWYGFFNAAVLERVRLASGGGLKATISGGGALPAHIDRFFNSIGIPVLEGYGLTETSPVLCVRTHQSLVIGTVGPALERTEIQIVSLDTGEILYPNPELPHDGRCLRGEIRVRGPQVMKGYYREPELSASVLRDGWFYTGDLGMVTFNDCLKILGRRKETIVLSSGENLEPGPIEMNLRQSPLIEQCMVVGQDQRFLGALIIPDLKGLQDRGIPASSHEAAAGDTRAHEAIRREIRRIISKENGFKNFEHIHHFHLMSKPFEVGEELTNLHKLRRHVIEENHADAIRKIFGHRPHNETRRKR